jgi:NDP-sugar pyrophosphorylase family protein
MALCGWKNVQTGDCVLKTESDHLIELAFSGIHFVKREIIELIPPLKKLSFTPFYLDLCEKQKIIGYNHSDDQWKDVGKIQELPDNEKQ